MDKKIKEQMLGLIEKDEKECNFELTSFFVSPADTLLIDLICKKNGCNKSEYVRRILETKIREDLLACEGINLEDMDSMLNKYESIVKKKSAKDPADLSA